MRKLSLVLGVLLCSYSAINAQSSGEFVGSVIDPSGSPVPGAKITVTEMATDLSRIAISGGEGFYSIPALRPALYRITVEAPGFRTSAQEGIRLEAEQKGFRFEAVVPHEDPFARLENTHAPLTQLPVLQALLLGQLGPGVQTPVPVH